MKLLENQVALVTGASHPKGIGSAIARKLASLGATLVITDLEMPGMDGFALVKKIKELYSDLMVFIFTGHDSFSMARKAQQFGADDFLLKPLDRDQLTTQRGSAL